MSGIQTYIRKAHNKMSWTPVLWHIEKFPMEDFPYAEYTKRLPSTAFLIVPSSGIEPETRGFSVLCSTN